MRRFVKKYIVGIFAVAISAGATIPFLFPVSFFAVYFLLLLAIAYSAIVFFTKPKNIYLFTFIVIALVGMSVGMVRGIGIHEEQKYQFSEYYGKKIILQGIVSEYPDERTGYTYLTLGSIKLSSSTEVFNERVLVRAPLYPKHFFGEKVEVSGVIQAPKNIETQGSRFSYPKYLSVQNIYSVISYPNVKTIQPADKSLTGSLYVFKNKCIDVITAHISEPSAGLLIGILFGIKKALSDEVLQNFITVGVVHIIVLSGYNIAIVVEAINASFRRLPPVFKRIAPYFAIYIFIIFVGASSTALRAGIMASIALFGKQSGRLGSTLQLLFIATAVLALYQPKIILYDTSFQLSFLATTGLIVFTPHMLTFCKRIPEKYALREITATTLATQITVVPFLLYVMGKVSLIGVVANILIVPIVPLVMLFGAATVALGLAYPPLAIPTAYISYILLSSILLAVSYFAVIPFASISVSINGMVLISLYVFEFLLVLFSVGNIAK